MSVRGVKGGGAGLADESAQDYDAVLVMSFGGPESDDDVMPFLRNVVRGRNVPEERLEAVAEHYYAHGGSPINAQNRELITALDDALANRGLHLPIYFGNRNWDPLITDTVAEMRRDGVKRAVAFVTSGFACYSGCRQYREDIVAALDASGGDLVIDKLRLFFNHPGFVRAAVAQVRAAHLRIPEDRQALTRLVTVAHSIPVAMAERSRYVEQLLEATRLVADGAGFESWDLVYQSRSGRPEQPWLEPDICDHLVELDRVGVTDIVLFPIGFISDHIEVLHDLDVEAAEVAARLNMQCVRAETVATHSAFIGMIADMIEERMAPRPDRPVLGDLGPSHDVCGQECCPIS